MIFFFCQSEPKKSFSREFIVTGRRPKAGTREKENKAGKSPPATAMGGYFTPELSQNLNNSYLFSGFPINYVFRHVVTQIGLHSSHFLREKRSSSPPGTFQTMICSKVSDQRNSKHAVHF